MIEEKKFFKCKKALELIDGKISESLGAISQIEKELKKKFKAENLKQGNKKLKKLLKKLALSKKEFKNDFKQFHKQFGKLVRAIENQDPKIHRIAKQCLKETKRGKGSGKKTQKGNLRTR